MFFLWLATIEDNGIIESIVVVWFCLITVESLVRFLTNNTRQTSPHE